MRWPLDRWTDRPTPCTSTKAPRSRDGMRYFTATTTQLAKEIPGSRDPSSIHPAPFPFRLFIQEMERTRERKKKPKRVSWGAIDHPTSDHPALPFPFPHPSPFPPQPALLTWQQGEPCPSGRCLSRERHHHTHPPSLRLPTAFPPLAFLFEVAIGNVDSALCRITQRRSLSSSHPWCCHPVY